MIAQKRKGYEVPSLRKGGNAAETIKEVPMRTGKSIPAKRKARHLPAGLEFTGFVLFDLFYFADLFVLYAYDRSKNVDLFRASQQVVSASIGTINTVLLLTSSWFVVVAIQMAKQENGKISAEFFRAAIGCGALFIMLKGFEYAGKFHAGLSLVTNDFYMYYFVLTGFHGVHVLIGMLLLSICWNKARTVVSCEAQIPFFEKCGTYWHVVDIIWIMLFALLYLVR